MRVLYAGSNIFGQVPNVDKFSCENYTDVEVDDIDWTKVTQLCIAHSVIILCMKNGEVVLIGHGLKAKETHAVTRLDMTECGGVKNVSTSDTRISAVNCNGELWVLDFLQKDITFKQKPKFYGDEKLTSFCIGVGISVGLSDKGYLYSGLEKLKFRNKNIVKVCTGTEHCLILTANGSVYSFGTGSRGQLGHSTLDSEEEPKLIDVLSGIKILDISCGNWHSCALSSEGDVYMWGWNCDGQLGLYDDEDEDTQAENTLFTPAEKQKPVQVYAIPKLLDMPATDEERSEDIIISKIGCGGRHSVFISNKNVVYGCGCNMFYQLALPKPDNYFDVQRICELNLSEGEFCQEIVCGPTCTTIIISR